MPGRILSLFGFAILSALILATRYANYQDVFIAGNVYFVDADCYARMTRVEMVSAKPGLIVRHHTFENFPQGTTPHTTAPLDYLILGLSLLLKRFTAQPLDMAGAFVSPFLALFEGWVLWWWSQKMKLRRRERARGANPGPARNLAIPGPVNSGPSEPDSSEPEA